MNLAEGTLGWNDLDAAPSPDILLAFLDAIAAAPGVAAAKGRSLAMLEVAPGHRVLDAGCGTGADAIELAARVHPGGVVVGVDSSALAIEATRRNAAGRRELRCLRAAATALPFPDGWFDSARADRVIQHVPDPAVAIQELVRVTRPGGIVVISEGTVARQGGGTGAPGLGSPRRLLPFIPVFLRRSGAGSLAIEKVDCAVEPNPELTAVLGDAGGSIVVRMVHFRGVVEPGPR